VLFKLAEADVSGEIFNIGPDEEFVSINTLSKIIAKLLDFKLDPIYVTGRPQEVKLANCSADKARKMLGYKTSTSLEDGLRANIEYIKERGPKPFTYHLDLEIVSKLTPKTWKNKMF
jgi:UDP-glucose 4-epimerase